MNDTLKDLGIVTEGQTVETLQAKCYEVYESPSMIFNPISNDKELMEDGFFTVTNSNGKIHGKVATKNSLLPLQDLIEIAYEVNLESELNLQFDRASIEYFSDQSIAELRIPLGVSRFRTRNGFNDKTDLFLFIKTGFGGNRCTEVGVYTYRFTCSNGMEIRHGLSYVKCKHTERMNEKIKVFLTEVLPNFTSSVKDFTKMAKKFDSKDITDEQVEAFRMKFFNYKKDEELSTKKSNMLAEFNISMKKEMDKVGQTVWGLLQSATNFTNHRHYSNSDDFCITGTGATLNATAEKHCLELVN